MLLPSSHKIRPFSATCLAPREVFHRFRPKIPSTLFSPRTRGKIIVSCAKPNPAPFSPQTQYRNYNKLNALSQLSKLSKLPEIPPSAAIFQKPLNLKSTTYSHRNSRPRQKFIKLSNFTKNMYRDPATSPRTFWAAHAPLSQQPYLAPAYPLP
jgi:hypothetical protein